MYYHSRRMNSTDTTPLPQTADAPAGPSIGTDDDVHEADIALSDGGSSHGDDLKVDDAPAYVDENSPGMNQYGMPMSPSEDAYARQFSELEDLGDRGEALAHGLPEYAAPFARLRDAAQTCASSYLDPPPH